MSWRARSTTGAGSRYMRPTMASTSSPDAGSSTRFCCFIMAMNSASCMVRANARRHERGIAERDRREDQFHDLPILGALGEIEDKGRVGQVLRLLKPELRE